MELATLLERCRAGDDLAWEALVRQFQGRIHGLALFYLGDREEARDLAQEVFIRVYRHLEACTDDRTFVPWMIRIARNAAIDRLRRIKARPPAAARSEDSTDDLRSSDPGPEEEWRNRERRALVHRALEGLSGINQEIIQLKEIQGLSLESIASLLRTPLGTIKSRSHRARLELARAIVALTGQKGSDLGLDP
jgi:RNA polymerase sigma-70 factor, ECF subfamily